MAWFLSNGLTAWIIGGSLLTAFISYRLWRIRNHIKKQWHTFRQQVQDTVDEAVASSSRK